MDVRLTLVDRTVDLIEEGEDLAIRIAREVAPGLAARPLCTMRYVLVASSAYLREHGMPASPAELARHRCIALRHSELNDQWTLERGADSVIFDVDARPRWMQAG